MLFGAIASLLQRLHTDISGRNTGCNMKPYSAVFTTMLMGACLLATEQDECQEIASEIVKRAFVGDAFFVGFLPKTNGWLSVDTSSDLHTWTTLASVATTNDVTAFVDENRTTVSMRFYRLRQPGTSVDEAEARWWQHASGDYQFHLQHIRSYASPSVLDADVIVRAGQKEVTNVQAEGEQPLQQPTARDFPAVPELFDLLREAQQSGCWRVAVTYDRAQGFPSWCVIERLAGGFSPKQIDGYRITRFTFTPTD